MSTARTEPVLAAPLSGVQLIEASAGTGKTWTIAGLYLRLVLEQHRHCEDILVVTFTDAATAELRERIRARLVAARAALVAGTSADPLLAVLAARAGGDPAVLAHVGNAIRAFDEAAIHTIHGFCARVLGDGAFEAALPFATELVADETALMNEIAADFWRREMDTVHPVFATYATARGYSPQRLCSAVRGYTAKPLLELRGAAAADRDAAAAAVQRIHTELRALWAADGPAVTSLLATDPGLNHRSYAPRHVTMWCAQLQQLLDAADPIGLAGFEHLDRYTPAGLADKASGRAPLPEHRFFSLCEQFVRHVRGLAAGLKSLEREFLHWCNAELAARKRRARQQSYDDQLLGLYTALHGAGGGALAARIRARHPVALIDEFQDTDPLQYAIFSAIYGAPAADGALFMVGDPKQAIYSFRGADVFTYLAGRQAATRTHALQQNWRSSAPLVGAFNTLFSRPAEPFLIGQVRYVELEAARAGGQALVVDGDPPAPLVLWQLPRRDDARSWGKGEAADFAAAATATEIVRLLAAGRAGRARLGDRVLGGGDIAVLVRSHREGALVRRALRARGVATVELGRENVFDSVEALELEIVLLAVAAPARDALVRAALGTQIAGIDGAGIAALLADETGWQRWSDRFHRLHGLWRVHGFMRMFVALDQELAMTARALRQLDGERRITNLRHLAELLQREESVAHAGMESLLEWYSGRLAAERPQDEEEQLRLESDENLVRIVTVHRSKGLEYPVVFCPFLWGALKTAPPEANFVWHDPDAGLRAVLDMGSDERPRALECKRREDFAESLRLFYVALTRSVERCYLLWGHVDAASTSAAAWFLLPPPDPGEDPIAALAIHVDGLGDAGQRAALAGLAATRADAIRLAEPAVDNVGFDTGPAPAGRYRSRRSDARVPAPWRVTSFSALATGAETLVDLPDHDAVAGVAGDGPGEGVRGIYAFPRGARAGSCLHAILERLDFTATTPQAHAAQVEHVLDSYGFERDWTALLCRHLHGVFATALDATGLRLADVGRDQRLDELEFHYPIARLSDRALRRVLDAADVPLPQLFAQASARLQIAPLHGYMKGYIDLVFAAGGRYYLVDYKSNWLGADVADYGAERLPAAMAREHYYLQYLVYTVALHRYLRRRLAHYDYDTHMGGAYYLFLRGMQAERGPASGVFHARPSRALVESLDALLAGNGERAG
ncbi:MAG: exodeoxyribonuclease V subunit beta [Gammaproteobacteria bacterium]|nr:exodeoxyribonuclease V subunit beta [Gammaproteobacteria bacterium]